MADPTGAAAVGVGAGISAMVMTIIGVDPQVLVWGVVGGVFGAPLAPPAGRWRSIAVFLAVACASALLGTWAADQWHEGARLARNAWALGLAAVFHPVFATLVQSVPSIVQAILRARTPGGQ